MRVVNNVIFFEEISEQFLAWLLNWLKRTTSSACTRLRRIRWKKATCSRCSLACGLNLVIHLKHNFEHFISEARSIRGCPHYPVYPCWAGFQSQLTRVLNLSWEECFFIDCQTVQCILGPPEKTITLIFILLPNSFSLNSAQSSSFQTHGPISPFGFAPSAPSLSV